MKKVLVIGSTVVDVIITLEEYLPRRQEDVHVRSQKMSLGGCAYNTSDVIRHFHVPYTLFSPVGTGAYGDFVRTQLHQKGIASPLPTPDSENGCCYCFIEKDGERTFISYHGAEYLFEPEWFDLICAEEYDAVYICGIEIEEKTGIHIVEWLENHPELTVYFAPGPRLVRMNADLVSRILALHPIIHLNDAEVCMFMDYYTGKTSEETTNNNAAVSTEHMKSSACALSNLTDNTVIVTLGADGAYYINKDSSGHIPGIQAKQIDTIGAGDSHIGTIIACRQLGMTFSEAIETANKIAAKVVETEGALLSDEEFSKLECLFPYAALII